MVVKSNPTLAAQLANKRLERVISSHRDYLSDWRAERFDRSSLVSYGSGDENHSDLVIHSNSDYNGDLIKS